MLKQLIHGGKVKKLGTMQVVTEIADLYPESDSTPVVQKAIPSMLHHIDRSNLEQSNLANIFRCYDQEEEDDDESHVAAKGAHFATKLSEASKFRSQISVI